MNLKVYVLPPLNLNFSQAMLKIVVYQMLIVTNVPVNCPIAVYACSKYRTRTTTTPKYTLPQRLVLRTNCKRAKVQHLAQIVNMSCFYNSVYWITV